MSERIIDKPIKTSIERCARCNGSHMDIVFKPFGLKTNPYYSHWSPCPMNGEPVLLKVEVDDNGS